VTPDSLSAPVKRNRAQAFRVSSHADFFLNKLLNAHATSTDHICVGYGSEKRLEYSLGFGDLRTPLVDYSKCRNRMHSARSLSELLVWTRSTS
jgi:hypothetical protein